MEISNNSRKATDCVLAYISFYSEEADSEKWVFNDALKLGSEASSDASRTKGQVKGVRAKEVTFTRNRVTVSDFFTFVWKNKVHEHKWNYLISQSFQL